MPGSGTKPPTRYTARMPSANRIRSRRSLIRKMLRNPCNACTLDDLRLAAGRLDGGLGRGAEAMGLDGQGLGHLAGAQHLDLKAAVADETGLHHVGHGDGAVEALVEHAD